MIDRKTFFERVERVFGSVPLSELSDDALVGALSVAQYASDMALVEAERRGLTDSGNPDFPLVPFELPEGVNMIETVLTRPR